MHKVRKLFKIHNAEQHVSDLRFLQWKIWKLLYCMMWLHAFLQIGLKLHGFYNTKNQNLQDMVAPWFNRLTEWMGESIISEFLKMEKAYLKTHKIIPILKDYYRKDIIFKINEIKCAYKGKVFLWLYEIVTKSHKDAAPWTQCRHFFLNGSNSFRRPNEGFNKCMPICDGTSPLKLPNPAIICFKINLCIPYHFTGNSIYLCAS